MRRQRSGEQKDTYKERKKDTHRVIESQPFLRNGWLKSVIHTCMVRYMDTNTDTEGDLLVEQPWWGRQTKRKFFLSRTGNPSCLSLGLHPWDIPQQTQTVPPSCGRYVPYLYFSSLHFFIKLLLYSVYFKF